MAQLNKKRLFNRQNSHLLSLNAASQRNSRSLSAALLMTAMATLPATAAENPFGYSDLPGQSADRIWNENKCGEGCCASPTSPECIAEGNEEDDDD